MSKLLLTVCIASALSGCFRDPAICTVVFDRVDELQNGSQVLCNGLTIGKVIDLKEYEKRILVRFELKDNIQIPKGSKFYVKVPLLGTSNLVVKFSDSTTFLTAKDTVSGSYTENPSLDSLISDTTKRRKIEQSLDKIATGVKELMETVRDSSKQQH
jgi:ABC-type transporter Mla subunit MlaD